MSFFEPIDSNQKSEKGKAQKLYHTYFDDWVFNPPGVSPRIKKRDVTDIKATRVETTQQPKEDRPWAKWLSCSET